MSQSRSRKLSEKGRLLKGLMGDRLWSAGDWIEWRWRYNDVRIMPTTSEILVTTAYHKNARFEWGDPELGEKLRDEVISRLEAIYGCEW